MMQSLATGAVSDAQELVPPHLRAGGPPDVHVPVHRLAAAAPGGRDGRPQPPALFARRRHGISLWWDWCCWRLPAASALLLFAAALIGTGSSVFHPESSRVRAHGLRRQARPGAVGVPGRRQFWYFRGPLLAAFIVLPHGQSSVAVVLARGTAWNVRALQVGHWYKAHGITRLKAAGAARGFRPATRRHVIAVITVLLALIFSKYVYLSSITSYYTFYLIGHFHVSVRSAQLHLFLFLASAAVGGFIGGPLGDRLGAKYIIWGSILGVLPFTLLLPYANLFWTAVLTIPIGLILSSAFPAIVVYAQDLMPGRTGTVAGLFLRSGIRHGQCRGRGARQAGG